MKKLNLQKLKKFSEHLTNLQVNRFDFESGIIVSGDWFPMPVSGRELIAIPGHEDRPIKSFNYQKYIQGLKDGYNEPVADPLKSIIEYDYLPAYFISTGECESTQAYDFGFEVGTCFRAWRMICDNAVVYGKEFNKMIDAYNSQFNTFADLLNVTEKEKLIDKIRPLLNNAKGVRVANVLRCLEDLNYLKFKIDDRIRNKVYKIIRSEFSLDFSDESVNKQLRLFETHRHKSDNKKNLIQKDFQFIKDAIK